MGTVNTVVATINGQTVTLTEGSNGQWSGTTTAPSSTYYVLDPQYYNVSISATDMASNVTTVDATHQTLGDDCKLVVKETVAPVISVSTPTAGQYVSSWPTLTASLTDSGSGLDASSLVVKLDGTTVSSSDYTLTVVHQTTTGTQVVTEYSLSYTPSGTLESGSHSFTIDIDDNDGNSATQVTRQWNAMVSAPTLDISTPASDGTWTNVNDVVFSGTTDASTSIQSLTISVDSGTPQTVSVGSTGAWSYTAEDLTDGLHSVTVVATGLSGLTTSATRTINVDTVAPTISAVSISPNPVDTGETYIITVTVSD